MIIQIRMTAEAEAAAQRYAMVVETWRAIFAQALDSRHFGTARGMSEAIDNAYRVGAVFLEQERHEIARILLEIASEAHTATLSELSVTDTRELTDAVSEHLSEAETHLAHEMTLQVERDIAFLRQSLQRAVLQVSIHARAHRIALKAALIQYRIGNAAELQFFYHDRMNRKWPSRKFVRAVWRHSLLSLYNEVVLLTLADHGLDRAEVSHLDPRADSNGLVLAMSSGTALPTYSEVRNDLFHPNSDAILARAS